MNEKIINLLRTILETNPKMSCASIEDTINKFRAGLEKIQVDDEEEIRKILNMDWSKQNDALLKTKQL